MIFVLLGLGLILLVLSLKYPEFFHWLFVYLLLDPGGYFTAYFNKGNSGGIFYMDLFFILTFIPLLTPKYNIKDFFKNKIASSVFYILLIFAFYQIFVFGLFVPQSDLSEWFRYFLLRERYNVFGFLIIIPVYLVAIRNLEYFFNIIVVFGFIILVLFFTTLLTNIELIPVWSAARYKGLDIIRKALLSTSYLELLVPASIIVYLTKINYKYTKILFLGGVFAIINEVLDLTKGELIKLAIFIIVTPIIVMKLLKLKRGRILRNFILFSSFSVIIMFMLFPNYINFAYKGFSDIASLVTTGTYEHGEEGRVVNQIPAQTLMIKQRPFFGTGYTSRYFSSKYNFSDYDVTDLPILGHIMRYGFIGIFLYIFYYFKIIKILRNLYSNIKRGDKNKIIQEYKYELFFSISLMAYFIAFFIKVDLYFIEMTNPTNKLETSIFIAILMACLYNISERNVFYLQKKKATNNYAS